MIQGILIFKWDIYSGTIKMKYMFVADSFILIIYGPYRLLWLYHNLIIGTSLFPKTPGFTTLFF